MPQKKSLKKVEKQQRLRDKVKKESERVEKTIGSLEIPDMNTQELMDHLKKMKAITPTVLALQFNIKVSMAKRLLEQLRKDRILNMVSKSHNLKVYAIKSD